MSKLTFSARPSLAAHCSVLNSSSCFLEIHSSYLACKDAIPSSTSARRDLAASKMRCVSCSSSVAFLRAAYKETHPYKEAASPTMPSTPKCSWILSGQLKLCWRWILARASFLFRKTRGYLPIICRRGGVLVHTKMNSQRKKMNFIKTRLERGFFSRASIEF